MALRAAHALATSVVEVQAEARCQGAGEGATHAGPAVARRSAHEARQHVKRSTHARGKRTGRSHLAAGAGVQEGERRSMAHVTIRPVQTTADEKKFLDFPYTFYKADPYWVAPLRLERKKLIDRQHNPFYHHAQLALYLAEDAGHVLGRIGAIVNANHNHTHQDRVGFFGFFECVQDHAVAHALFDAAQAFLHAAGMEAIRGPATPSVNDEYGVLVDGFQASPVVLMPYNPPYYSALMEGYGFTKAKDLFAYLLDQETVYTDKVVRAHALVTQRHHLTFRSINMRDFAQDVQRIKAVYNAAWQANWGAVAMTDAEFDALAHDLKRIVEPDLVILAEAHGQLIGFALSLPDINRALKYNKNGRLLGGVWHLYTKKKEINLCRILVLGVLPGYHKTGAAGVLFFETAARAKQLGYRYGEASWILEDNVMMNRAAQAMQGIKYKTYRIYQKAL
jgi:GNAT superfamily N-acetyltransferase